MNLKRQIRQNNQQNMIIFTSFNKFKSQSFHQKKPSYEQWLDVNDNSLLSNFCRNQQKNKQKLNQSLGLDMKKICQQFNLSPQRQQSHRKYLMQVKSRHSDHQDFNTLSTHYQHQSRVQAQSLVEVPHSTYIKHSQGQCNGLLSEGEQKVIEDFNSLFEDDNNGENDNKGEELQEQQIQELRNQMSQFFND